MNFIQSETQIVNLFRAGARFNYNGSQYVTLINGKPTVSRGEPKSDIYVLARVEGTLETKEFKISYKQLNADFLENKISDTRAEEIFGAAWSSRIQEFTTSIRDQFEQRNLICFQDFGSRIKEGSITLGWKFEIVNRYNGGLSSEIYLTPNEILEIYAGRGLREDKRNARVNGEVIPNSGVAEYILVGDCASYLSAQDVINDMLPINEYAVQNPRLFFACKAHNYNTLREKMDGNRYLSVYVDWNIEFGKLTPTLVFDEPLVTRANAVRDKLLTSLNIISVNNTRQLDARNLSSITHIRGI